MTKMMIVVDMVRGFLEEKTEDGPCALYLKGAKSIIPNIRKEIDALGPEDILIFVSDSHSPKDPELKKWPRHCMKGTEEVLDDLLPRVNRKVWWFPKNTFNAFFNTGLIRFVKNTKPDELIIVGLCTDICVFATALDACYRGYKVTIPRDCVFPLYPERGEYLLKYLVDMFGITVR